MQATYMGKISGPIWGNVPETGYTIIVDSVDIDNQADRNMLLDEVGVPCFGAIVGKGSEIEIEARIKGASHIGKNSLIGTKITSLKNLVEPLTDAVGPFFIISNKSSTEKEGFAACSMTVYFGDTDWDSQTRPGTVAATTTGA